MYCVGLPLFPYFACLHKPIPDREKVYRVSERTDPVRSKWY